MKIKANGIDFRDLKRFDSFSSVIFNCIIKYCCFDKKLNNNLNDARKAVKTFCISKISIVGFNFLAQNVLFPNLQSAKV